MSKFPCCFFRSKKITLSFVFVYLLVTKDEFKTLGIAPCKDVDLPKLSVDRLVSTRSRAVGTRVLVTFAICLSFFAGKGGGVTPPYLSLFRADLLPLEAVGNLVPLCWGVKEEIEESDSTSVLELPEG